MPDALICDALRTPFGRYGGALSSIRTDDLAAIPLKALMERNPGVEWAEVDDVIYGCANQSGEDNRNVARMALLLAGLPQGSSGRNGKPSVRIQPGSGGNGGAGHQERRGGVGDRRRRRKHVARALRDGQGGRRVLARGQAGRHHARLALHQSVNEREDTAWIQWRRQQKTWPMSFTSRAKTRMRLRYRSQQRAAAAIASGAMAEEIYPVTIPQRKGAAVVVDKDEHPRPETTIEALAKLKPIVKPTGTITAGNASGINDGACGVLLASEAAAKKYGLTPKARVVTAAAAGVAPRVMGMGPVPASRKALAMARLAIGEMDVIELNEAFAAQGLAVLRELGVPDDSPKVNPNGGAIAIGHPLGASGGRLVTTALYQLQRTKGRYALCTMCIGVGQGIAMVVERV